MQGQIVNIHTKDRGFIFAKANDEQKVLLHVRSFQDQSEFDGAAIGDFFDFAVQETNKGLKGYDIHFVKHGERHRGVIWCLSGPGNPSGFIKIDGGDRAFFHFKECNWQLTCGVEDAGTQVEFDLETIQHEGKDELQALRIIRVDKYGRPL
jgi:hypothetical protein